MDWAGFPGPSEEVQGFLVLPNVFPQQYFGDIRGPTAYNGTTPGTNPTPLRSFLKTSHVDTFLSKPAHSRDPSGPMLGGRLPPKAPAKVSIFEICSRRPADSLNHAQGPPGPTRKPFEPGSGKPASSLNQVQGLPGRPGNPSNLVQDGYLALLNVRSGICMTQLRLRPNKNSPWVS